MRPIVAIAVFLSGRMAVLGLPALAAVVLPEPTDTERLGDPQGGRHPALQQLFPYGMLALFLVLDPALLHIPQVLVGRLNRWHGAAVWAQHFGGLC